MLMGGPAFDHEPGARGGFWNTSVSVRKLDSEIP